MPSTSAESTGISLSSEYYLRNFYKNNRKLFKTSNRDDYTESELSYEDSRALKRAAKALESYDYDEADNGANIVSTIEAFVDTYNNVLSSSDSKDSDAYRYNKQLQRLTKQYKDELEDIGVSINKDGTLSISENILKGSTHNEVKKVFSKEAGYTRQLTSISKRMNANSYEEIYAQLTGCGGSLNITL